MASSQQEAPLPPWSTSPFIVPPTDPNPHLYTIIALHRNWLRGFYLANRLLNEETSSGVTVRESFPNCKWIFPFWPTTEVSSFRDQQLAMDQLYWITCAHEVPHDNHKGRKWLGHFRHIIKQEADLIGWDRTVLFGINQGPSMTPLLELLARRKKMKAWWGPLVPDREMIKLDVGSTPKGHIGVLLKTNSNDGTCREYETLMFGTVQSCETLAEESGSGSVPRKEENPGTSSAEEAFRVNSEEPGSSETQDLVVEPMHIEWTFRTSKGTACLDDMLAYLNNILVTPSLKADAEKLIEEDPSLLDAIEQYYYA
ncbi:hypothetical protein ACLMJK_009260 [Lecanora helva]